MAIARMRRACLASAIRAASARNCEILRSWRVISIADIPPRPPNQQQDESSHACGCLGIPQESDSRALGITQMEYGGAYSPVRNPDELVWKHLKADTVGRMAV